MRFWSIVCGWFGFGPAQDAAAVPVLHSGLVKDDDSAWELESRGYAAVAEVDLPQAAQPEIAPEAWWICARPEVHSAPLAELTEPADLSLLKELHAFVDSPDIDLPHLPHIPQRVLTLMRKPDINYPVIAKVLSQDQTLSASVLRLSNSALFAGLQPVSNLEVALSRLGMKHLQNLMLKESLKAITIRKTAHGRSLSELLWKKSVACGVVMERLARPFGIAPEDGFVAGLLHDIGEMVLLRLVHDYQKLTRQTVPRHIIESVWEEYHERMGGSLADHWNLPGDIKALIQQHHGMVVADEPLCTQRCLLQITDHLVALMGYGRSPQADLLDSAPARMIRFGTAQQHIDLLDGLPDAVNAELHLPI